MSRSVDPVVRLTFPAKSDYLLLARLALAGLARGLPLDAEAVADLKLAVTEACGNVVRHAYADGKGGTVSLALVVEADRVKMIVEDRGTGMDGTAAGDSDVDTLPEGGMGMSILRAVVDELDISRGDDGTGTVVKMTKYFAAPA